MFNLCLKYCADILEPAWGRGSSYGPMPHDWVQTIKLVSGGVSLLDGARLARPPAINDR